MAERVCVLAMQSNRPRTNYVSYKYTSQFVLMILLIRCPL